MLLLLSNYMYKKLSDPNREEWHNHRAIYSRFMDLLDSNKLFERFWGTLFNFQKNVTYYILQEVPFRMSPPKKERELKGRKVQNHRDNEVGYFVLKPAQGSPTYFSLPRHLTRRARDRESVRIILAADTQIQIAGISVRFVLVPA